ncbi:MULTISPECIES: hypothetical protein [Massilia]|jgi:hypothetical protein|uniref:hypothetical protein n=1 Tax=Massilia TaxID=149698 RepID=UPI001269C1A6|nr:MULTISPECIES: hypothetical protein [Massilia]
MLLTIMMLQLSWSVVAEYCEHETGRAAQHLGHHASHDEPAQEVFSSLDQPSKSKAGALHSHCTSCTHTPLTFEELPVVVAVSEPLRFAPSSPLLRFSSTDVAPPERPQWVAVV